jgi:glyoxylase-like metal-dependent hydrolase (beta-lactamase superfamily II)
MSFRYAQRADNVYMIDTQMFGFPHFNSAYIVAGKEVALIDTGAPLSGEIVRNAIKKHGFSIQDISYIFITHCEHPDHSGNVGRFIKENTRAKVYINPVGAEYLTKPEIEDAKRKAILPEKMAARFGEMVPVPESRLYGLKDGEQFDLGNGEILKAVFTPGHQPSGMVIWEAKNSGLFINDLAGLYLADAGASWIFTPFNSDVIKARESLNKIIDLPMKRLYLGHFGICDKPREIIQGALDKIQRLLDIGEKCIKDGKKDEIARTVFNTLLAPELEKIRAAGRKGLYEYVSRELTPSISEAFARYYLQRQSY